MTVSSFDDIAVHAHEKACAGRRRCAGRLLLMRPGMAALLAVVLATTGCQTTTTRSQGSSSWLGKSGDGSDRDRSRIDSTRIETRDDVVQIVTYWNQPYWMQDSERVRGFKTTVYFVSGQTEKGAFVSGDIYVWLYELTTQADGRTERKMAHGWQFNQAEARALRVNRVAVGGYFYGMPLRWPEELHLEGKQIEIQVGYERRNGGVVLSSPRRFKVPVPIDYQGPDAPLRNSPLESD